MGLVGLLSEALSGMCRTEPDCRMAAHALSGLHFVMSTGFVGLISEALSGMCRTALNCRMAAVPYPAYIP